ncbi:hypothetical protein BIV60_14740 [Bacillus sp. MUM 116]|uniref:RQC-minor-1 family DNA-binding protein n=1 Tax=Bacillus sp. MUM 116 TaxID=1678002 RepID=UPI0008F57726|nr:RQC-minor-1 family DNA-binding protein [Bacillus sp. MUM 116]OIK13062.1 hypothetical protein BIV60_14740 [Bacillus sp. MUM 116]
MGKKEKRVGYELNANGIKSLPDEEIKLILRGADDLIMSGGRAMLAKILAGSKDKKLLELEFDVSPVYGSFKGMSQKDILAKIDWMILNDYLEIEYNYRLPVLVFTDLGWKIERETYANELLDKLINSARNQTYEFVEELKERNRGMILLLLDKIEESGNKELINILKAWQEIEYKKLRTRIQEVINRLENAEGDTEIPSDEDVISFSANKKWHSIPAELRQALERNVFCGKCCDAVQIVDYTVKDSPPGIILQGKCKNCGGNVARFIE